MEIQHVFGTQNLCYKDVSVGQRIKRRLIFEKLHIGAYVALCLPWVKYGQNPHCPHYPVVTKLC
jgi:hypothetical protein